MKNIILRTILVISLLFVIPLSLGYWEDGYLSLLGWLNGFSYVILGIMAILFIALLIFFILHGPPKTKKDE